MARITRLTENDLTRLIRRVVMEQHALGEIDPQQRGMGLKDPQMTKMSFQEFVRKYNRQGGTSWKLVTDFGSSYFIFTDSQNKTFMVDLPPA